MSNLCPRFVQCLSKLCQCPSFVQLLMNSQTNVNVLSNICLGFVQYLPLCPNNFKLVKTWTNSCPMFVQFLSNKKVSLKQSGNIQYMSKVCLTKSFTQAIQQSHLSVKYEEVDLLGSAAIADLTPHLRYAQHLHLLGSVSGWLPSTTPAGPAS